MPPPVSLRTIVYIDGFNFYYGVLKNTPYKWLDLERFYTLLRPHDRIQTIKFFTSLVHPGPHRLRQDTLLKALRTCAPMVEVILGRLQAAHRSRQVPLQLLPVAQLPARVPDGAGGFIEKPTEW